jgi:hypothetical protein
VSPHNVYDGSHAVQSGKTLCSLRHVSQLDLGSSSSGLVKHVLQPFAGSSTEMMHVLHPFSGSSRELDKHVLHSLLGSSHVLTHVVQFVVGSSFEFGHDVRLHLCLYLLLLKTPNESVHQSLLPDSQPGGQLLLVLSVVCADRQQPLLSVGSEHSNTPAPGLHHGQLSLG